MKDRRRAHRLAADVEVIVTRSSHPPIEYAIMLVALRDDAWRTVRTFDNAHATDEHHEHAYSGSVKQQPIITYGTPNDAMAAALAKIRETWSTMVSDWEQTR